MKDFWKKMLYGVLLVCCLFGLYANIGDLQKAISNISSSNSGGKNNSSGGLNSKENAGYSFIVKRLKSPSSANLIECIYSDDIKKVVEKAIDSSLPSCITVGYFEVEAQNSFGGMVRNSYWVFYRNGVPCHLETTDDIDYVIRSGNPSQAIHLALSSNGCGCN